MAISDTRLPWRLGMLIYSIGCILFFIGFATTYWYKVTKLREGVANFGLIRICQTNYIEEVCEYLSSYDGITDWMKVGLALACIGKIIYAVGWVVAFIGGRRSKKILMIVGAGTGIAAGVLGIIAGIVVLTKAHKEFDYPPISSVSNEWSAIVFLFGCSLAILGGSLQFGGVVGQQVGEHSRLLNG